MTTTTPRLLALRSLPPLPPVPVALCGLFLAFTLGAAMARGLPTGVALLFALVYTPIVLLNLPLGFAIWVVVWFIEALPFVWIGPTAASLLVLLAWFGTAQQRRSRPSPFAGRERIVLGAAIALVVWLLVSRAWAREPGTAPLEIRDWIVALAVLAIAATILDTRRRVELVIAAFVGGAALSVALGLLAGGFVVSPSAFAGYVQQGGRLVGGSADPNYLAAGIVPAMALGGGLLAVYREPLVRLILGCTLGGLAVGLVASQSRGGRAAAATAFLVAVVVLKGRRMQLLVPAGIVALMIGIALASAPAALERIQEADNGGSGRNDLWEVALKMVGDRPLQGVGMSNYRVVSKDYTDRIGSIDYAKFFVEEPQFVHNAYLQIAAESGLIGLALLLTAILGALTATRRADWAFAAAGDDRMATLTRCVLIAQAGALASSVFLSNASDKRTWLLLALGPALLFVARRGERTRT